MLIFDFIDEVIAIIRRSDDPKAALLKRFELTESQVESILEIKLRQLAKIAEQALLDEQKRLEEERSALEAILNVPGRLEQTMVAEIGQCLDKFGDDRRTLLVQRDKAVRFDVTASTKSIEDVTVVLSKHGWIRAGKGHAIDPGSLSFRTGDQLGYFCKGRSNDTLVLFSSTGRCFAIKVDGLPSIRAQGEPITKYIDFTDGKIEDVLLGHRDDVRVLIVTAGGYGFVTTFADCLTKNKSGKAVVSFSQGDRLLPVQSVLASHHFLAIVTLAGRLSIIELDAVPSLKKGKGVRLCHILPNDFAEAQDACHASVLMGQGDSLVIQSGRRSFTLKPSQWQPYVTARAKRGKFIPQGFRKVSALSVLSQEDDNRAD